jgi:mRNA interferase MazF
MMNLKSSRRTARKILVTMTEGLPQRGEVWQIRFDPSEGDEIQKQRPAVVVNIPEVGRMGLRIVVPLTNWRDGFFQYPWMVKVESSVNNGLRKPSAADTFQVKSVALTRFIEQLGVLTASEMDHITAAIVLCVGYVPPSS